MNRASSAVFHSGEQFSPSHLVDAVWIEWKAGPELMNRANFSQQAAAPDR